MRSEIVTRNLITSKFPKIKTLNVTIMLSMSATKNASASSNVVNYSQQIIKNVLIFHQEIL